MFFLYCLICLVFFHSTEATPLPTPIHHHVNVLTGEIKDPLPPSFTYERYEEGWNSCGTQSLILSSGDDRIGKIKTIHQASKERETGTHFSYEPGATSVVEFPGSITVYHFTTDTNLVQIIENYFVDSLQTKQLYRRERFFWQTINDELHLINRSLEDEEGKIVGCHCFFFNQNGQLIQDSLFGNLTGYCTKFCVISQDGYPERNGVEFHNTFYEYSDDHSEIPIRQIEDYDSSAQGDLQVLRDKEMDNLTFYPPVTPIFTPVFQSSEGNTTCTYDCFGRLIETKYPTIVDANHRPHSPIVRQSYNILDQIVQLTDANEKVTETAYNIRGQPIEIRHPDGSKESFRYYLNGQLREKITREGMYFLYLRDRDGRISREDKYSPSNTLLHSHSYTYKDELVESIIDQTNSRIDFVYDDQAHLVKTTKTTPDITRSYFLQKSIEESSTPSNHANPISHIRNALGQLVRQEEQMDRAGIKTLLTFDAMNRLENVIKTDPNGLKISESYFRHDGKGNKIFEKHVVISSEGTPTHTYTIHKSYDASDRVTSIREEGEGCSKTTFYHYNCYGQLQEIIKPDGTHLSYSYNSDGLLEKFQAGDHSFAYQYVYDDQQQLREIFDCIHHKKQKRTYNTCHELISEEQNQLSTIGYQYDENGRCTAFTLPDSSQILYHYQDHLLSSIERIGKDSTPQYQHFYDYDSDERVKTSSLCKNLGTIGYEYDGQSKLMAIHTPWNYQKQLIGSYNDLGQLNMLTKEDDTGVHRSTYNYTNEGQLSQDENNQYTYDSLFNRTAENGQEWKSNSINQVIRTPLATYAYDTNGNLVEKKSAIEKINYTYDALNRMIRIESGDHAMSYIYDSFDRRIEETLWKWDIEQKSWISFATECILYDGFKDIGKLNEQGEIIELRVLGLGQGAELGAAVAFELQGNVYVPIHDFFGSVSGILDAQGRTVERYTYSAFGQENIWNAEEQHSEHSIIGNPWRFCSKRKNSMSGLVSFGKREYDPILSRWMTPDCLPFIDTPNLYAFVKNDPLNNCDLYGLFSMNKLWNKCMSLFFSCFQHLQRTSQESKSQYSQELRLPPVIGKSLEKAAKTLFGESTYLLMGPYSETTQISTFGDSEINDKVRLTFINGILNTSEAVLHSLQILSESHGGEKIHYVFRPTQGWTWDISFAIAVKVGFKIGFRSEHAHLLAHLWRKLIQEMGGVDGGGTIVHYAHSLGGAETDRACELLTAEEQKMIRVVTFGPATLVRNLGFQKVTNNVSMNDGVCSVLLEPIGHIRAFFDPDCNVRYHGSLKFHGFIDGTPYWPTDHFLNGPTYGPLIYKLGEEFLNEFSSPSCTYTLNESNLTLISEKMQQNL